MTPKSPYVTVVIPLMAIGDYVVNEGLPAFKAQTYQNFEVILLPNKKTRKDSSLLEKYSFLRLIETNDITRPAQKRDIGVKRAEGDIVAFIDDDAYPDRNWIKNAVGLINSASLTDYNKKIIAVCGPGVIPPHGVFWEKVFDTILQSRLGSGGYTYRFRPEKARYVDDYPSMNFFVRRDVFEKIGGFNNNFWPGEDSKLCEDIVYKLGAKIQYDPSILVYHHRRPNLGHFLKQHGQYGYHRGAFFAHGDRNSRRLSYLIPTFFDLYLIFLTAMLLIQPISTNFSLSADRQGQFQFYLIIPLIVYKMLLAYQLLITYIKYRSLKIALFSTIVLFLMHVYYGLKFVHGFIVGLIKKEQIYG